MDTLVKMVYQKKTGELNITCSGRTFDVSNIRDLSIEQWGFPFVANGVRWRGLYEELKTFVGSDNFSLQFEGDDASFEVLKYIFEDTPVSVCQQLENKVVTIIYSENPFTTRIIIDGTPLDTEKIQNRSIDEWVSTINTRGIQWLGIFTELENYLHSTTYTIFFIGEQKDMEFLLGQCPDTVNIFYRDPKVVQMMYQSNRSGGTESAAGSEKKQAGGMTARRFHMKSSFTRVRENKVFSGICSGLAKSMDVRPWVVRLIGIIFMAVIFVVFLVSQSSLSLLQSQLQSSASMAFFINIGICLVYIILTFLVPLEGAEAPYKRVREDKVLAGVCSGLAKQMEMKAWVVRLVGIICMVFLPLMVNGTKAMLFVDMGICLAYIALIFVTPLEDETD